MWSLLLKLIWFVSDHSCSVHVESDFTSTILLFFQALKLLAPGTAPLAQKALSSVPHERSRVVLHSDVSLMPRDRRDWRSVNFVIDSVPSLS
jgi:hypothetical protein